MSPALLVLFSRSLLMDTRKVTTFLARLLLLVLVLFMVLNAQVFGTFRFGAPGLILFSSLMWLSLTFITLAGVFFFSSAITEEKEEMHLGLLKMTGLSSLSILLGKGGSRVVGGLMLLLAQFPFTLLAITLGGVSLRQVVAAYCTLIAYLVLVGGVSLLFSGCVRHTSTAGALTLLALVAFFVGPAFDSWLNPGLSMTAPSGVVGMLVHDWAQANPFVRLAEILQTGFNQPPIGFQVAANVILGLVFFGLLWLLFERFTREEKVSSPKRPLGRVGRPWSAALAWKEFHFGAGGKLMLLVRPVIVGLVLGFIDGIAWLGNGVGMETADLATALMVVSLILCCLEMLRQASRMLNSERQWRTLGDLMILPMTPNEILRQKVLGILPGLLPYALTFVLGALVAPDRFVEGLSFLGSPIFWIMLAEGVLWLYLTAYMSLVVKHGTLLLASVILMVGNQLAAIPASVLMLAGGESFVYMMGMVVLVFWIVVLHIQLVRRMVRVAAE